MQTMSLQHLSNTQKNSTTAIVKLTSPVKVNVAKEATDCTPEIECAIFEVLIDNKKQTLHRYSKSGDHKNIVKVFNTGTEFLAKFYSDNGRLFIVPGSSLSITKH